MIQGVILVGISAFLGEMARIAVLGSGTGSNFEALHEALGEEIALVISDRPEAGILEKAKRAGVRALCEKGGSDLSERILGHLDGIDLVCLAGFMRLVREPLLSAFSGRILNIHPSLLPKYPGLRAWEQAIADGATESGCTVHFVDAGVDTGEVVMQAKVPVRGNDTPENLHARIQVEEHRIYPLAVRKVLGKAP